MEIKRLYNTFLPLLFLSLPAAAQLRPEEPAQRTLFPNVLPGTISNVRHSQPVRYQTADRQWHDGQLHELKTERVYLVNDYQQAIPYLPTEVIRVVLPDATYGGVGRFFAKELFAAGNTGLYQYQNMESGFVWQLLGTQWWLRRPDGAVVKLRGSRAQFSRQMLGVVGDDPELAKRLQARAYRRRDATAILEQYQQWKQAQVGAATQ